MVQYFFWGFVMRKGFNLLSTLAFVLLALPGAAGADPLVGGVEAQKFIENSNSNDYSYPAPTMMQPTPDSVRPPRVQKAAVQQIQRPPQQKPLQAQVQQSVELPKGFMGAWLVQGQRTNMQALPQYQGSMGQFFQTGTRNVWNISGNPRAGYTLTTDQGVSTKLNIHKVAGNTAFILYQHPISKTMAKEAIVMELQNGGASFSGLERITIVKPDINEERAKVTYQLVGQRQ